MSENRKWILVRDIYDTEPYQCPYCGARVPMQKVICPNCNKAVVVIPFEVEESKIEHYERLIETLVKLP